MWGGFKFRLWRTFIKKNKKTRPQTNICARKCDFPYRQRSHKAHLHWQKPKSKKPGFFVVPFTLPENPITFGVFGTKSACAKKPESHTCVVVSGAHARLLSTFDRTRVVHFTSRAAVGWFRWRSRTTWPKTRIIPARLERAFTLAKNQWNFGGV